MVCSAVEGVAAQKRHRGPKQQQNTTGKSNGRRNKSSRALAMDDSGGGSSGAGAGQAKSHAVGVSNEGGHRRAKSAQPLVFVELLSLRVEDCPQLTAVELVVPSLRECTLKCARLERASLSFASHVRLLDCSGCHSLLDVPFADNDDSNSSNIDLAKIPQRLLPGGRWGAHPQKQGRSLQQLRAAGLRDCVLLEEDFVRRFIDHCRQLTRLDIVGTAASPSLGRRSTPSQNKQEQDGQANAAGKKGLSAGWRQRPSGRTDHRTKVKTTGWLQKVQLARPALEVLYSGKKNTAAANAHRYQRQQQPGVMQSARPGHATSREGGSWQTRWLAEGGEVRARGT
jgi:hypothetical protein